MPDAYIQMSLDELIFGVQTDVKETLKVEPVQTTVPVSAEKTNSTKKEKTSEPKPELPKEFLDRWEKVSTLEDLEEFGLICPNKPNGNLIYADVDGRTDRTFTLYYRGYRESIQFPSYLYYVDPNGRAWVGQFGVDLKAIQRQSISPAGYRRTDTIGYEATIQKGKWKPASRLYVNYGCANSKLELLDILKTKKPYTYEFLKERTAGNISKYNALTLLAAPEIESLYKAGYAFSSQYFEVLNNNWTSSNVEKIDFYNRLIKHLDKPGKLKNIFKTSTAVCKVLKNESNMEIWDSFRKMEKFGKIAPQDIQLAYDANLSVHQIERMATILARKYQGKNIFTFSSLIEYLQRVDMYEAISIDEALQLIKDYLFQCQSLGIKPKIDGDSLKREHDVVSRNYRIAASINRNAGYDEKLVEAVENLKKYDYEEDVFFVRGIRSHKDLLDEASQQHNCVASYYHRICDGTTLIFVMREKNNPNKSLVTIELSTDGQRIHQKYLAYNRPIHNAAQSEFLERWHNHVKAVMKGEETSHILSSELDPGAKDLIDYSKNAYYYGCKHEFGIGYQPMENLIKRERDPEHTYISILVYSKPLSEADVNKYELTLVKSPDIDLFPNGTSDDVPLDENNVEVSVDV